MDELAVVDWIQALSLADNNAELAHELFAMLRRDLPRVRATLAAAQLDSEGLRDAVHKLHGATVYCGVPRLHSAAATLDAVLRSDSLVSAERRLMDLFAAIDATLAVERYPAE